MTVNPKIKMVPVTSIIYSEIKITKLQVSGKKQVSVKDYINGIKKEELLGQELK